LRIKELENNNYDLTQANKNLTARVEALESGSGEQIQSSAPTSVPESAPV